MSTEDRTATHADVGSPMHSKGNLPFWKKAAQFSSSLADQTVVPVTERDGGNEAQIWFYWLHKVLKTENVEKREHLIPQK